MAGKAQGALRRRGVQPMLADCETNLRRLQLDADLFLGVPHSGALARMAGAGAGW